MPRLLYVYILLIASVGHASAPQYESSFKTGRDWSVIRGTASVDPAVSHAGKHGLRVERSSQAQDASVALLPVVLSLGKRMS